MRRSKKRFYMDTPQFSYLCSNHFTSGDFEVLQKTRRLRINSVPFVFKFPDHITKKCKRERTSLHYKVQDDSGSFDINQQSFYLGDYTYSSKENEVTCLKRKLENANDKIRDTCKKLKAARKQLNKQSVTITSLLDEVKELKLLNETDKNMMEHCFTELQVEMLTKNCGKPFSDEMKTFACTLHLYSSKTYEYLRTTLNLSYTRTLRCWMENIDGNPGLCKEMFTVIEGKILRNDETYY